ncbi:MAG: nucleotidyltransferase domain-containing protein [Turicibacter sp.]|nr:nucleotidyltransferase domain-containing protein [Turicibacter sp.]
MTRENVIEIITPVLEKYPVRRAALFGSYAREEQRTNSDVDLIVDLEDSHRLLFFDLYDDLENILDIEIDLIPFETIERCRGIYTIAKNIDKDLRWFYEQ